MSLGKHNKQTARQIVGDYLEDLTTLQVRTGIERSEPSPSVPLAAASARVPHSDEWALQPTCQIGADQLIGLLDKAATVASLPPPTRSARDELMTQPMRADQFRELLRASKPKGTITPTVLESIDWDREADAPTKQTLTARHEFEDTLEKFDDESTANGIAVPLSELPPARPSPPRLEQPAASVMPPLCPPTRPPARPRRADAPRAIRRPLEPTRPPARSSALRVLISLLVLALVCAIFAHEIVDALAGLLVPS